MYAVMLAKPFFHPKTGDPKVDPTGWLMSEKLDGVRAYWDGHRFWSRGGKVYNAPEWFIDELPMNVHLDGELWLDRGEFDKASGICRRKEPTDEWADLTFLVFDAPKAEGGFEQRMEIATEALASRPKATYAKIVDQEVCENMKHLQDRMNKILKLKGEGVMLRRAGSPYIRSRTGDLLKVKKFLDDDAMVYAHQEGTGKHEGRMGALLVYWIPNRANPKEIVKFKIGTGFSDAERDNPPAVGKIVKFSYQEKTKDLVPRFPVYLGVKA